MKIGINEYILSQEIGFKASIQYLSGLGFDCIDFCFYERNQEFEGEDYVSVAQAYKKICDDYSIKVHQMHANWFKNEDDEPTKAYKIKMNERSIEIARILDCAYIVFHATKFKGYYSSSVINQSANDYNIELFKHYIDIAKKHQVNVAIENMFGYVTHTTQAADTIFATATQMNHYMDVLGEYCVACLDTGHAYIAQQNIADMVKTLDRRLKVLHIHDAIMSEDAHLVPTLGLIDWPSFFASLVEHKFEGVLSLEILPPSTIGIQTYIKYGYEIIKHYERVYWG